MGTVRMGPPTDLILKLGQEFSVKNFVETGTFQGGTSKWAASHFDQVTTIENSRLIYDQTVANLGYISNIKFLFGNSRDVLREVVPGLQSPALFWLDGHWCGGESYGAQDECPLIDELEILNESPFEHFLLIDDARLFLSPPPLPHQIKAWPSIADIVNTIQAKAPNKYIVIFEDVIIAVPQHAQELVAHWCQGVVTKSANAGGTKNKNIDRLKDGIRLVKRGLHSIRASQKSKILSFPP